MIIFNIPALFELMISFGIAGGIGYLFGTTAEGPIMLMAGPLAIACDLVYRLKRDEGHLFHPGGGGALFFLPVWLFGVLWTIIGIGAVIKGGL